MASVVENRRPLFFVDLRFVDLWGGRGRPPGQPAHFVHNEPISAPGFLLARDDRSYIVLDLSADDSWGHISHQLGRLLLNYNYPRTPGWCDEGLGEYFSRLRLANKRARVGSDPE